MKLQKTVIIFLLLVIGVLFSERGLCQTGDSFIITATAGLNGTIDPSGAVTVPAGFDQTFTIAADIGYHVSDVKVNGVSVGAGPSYTYTAVSSDSSIEAYFAPDAFTISVNGSGVNGGTIIAEGIINATWDGSATLGDNSESVPTGAGPYTIIAAATVQGVHVSWSGGCDYVSGDDTPSAECVINAGVSSDKTLTAVFALNTYTITATSGPNGRIDPSGSIPGPLGVDQTFTFFPDAGYHISDVKVNGSSIGNPTSYTFTNVTSNGNTIEVSFAPDTFDLIIAKY